MTKYWMGVACLEHVQRGIAGGFAQVCHGKCGPLNNMSGGDWIIYYSPVLQFGRKEPCRAFTAIGKIDSNSPYTFEMSPDFIPWRRDVKFFNANQAPIEPLLDQLSFIQDKKKWGYPFKRGCFEINEKDFLIIIKAMGVNLKNE